MSVWILKLAMTPEEEQKIGERSELPLPYEGVPDIRGAHHAGDLRALMIRMNPDTPPERLVRRAETYWRNFSQLRVEDLILVPFAHSAGAALAQVETSYIYRSEDGKDIHVTKVIWLETHIPKRKYGSLSKLIKDAYDLEPVENAEDRKAIYRLLKRPYNRFAKIRWILGILIILQLAVMMMGMFRQ